VSSTLLDQSVSERWPVETSATRHDGRLTAETTVVVMRPDAIAVARRRTRMRAVLAWGLAAMAAIFAGGANRRR
jgi:hypothetical protein